MAYSGQRPKDDSQRVRRNKPVYDKIPLAWDGIVRGPALPKNHTWCARTKEWWKAFRRSPQAMVCVESDWFFLQDTALIYDHMWRDPGNIPDDKLKSLMAEFRIRMSSYATTYDDRLKMRVVIKSDAHELAEEAQLEADAEDGINYLERMNKAIAETDK